MSETKNPVPANLRYDGLTVAQTRVLGWIAMGADSGHHPRTLRVLLDRGLIAERSFADRGDPRFPVTVNVYEMPLAEHMRYCQWCSEVFPDEEILAPASPKSAVENPSPSPSAVQKEGETTVPGRSFRDQIDR